MKIRIIDGDFSVCRVRDYSSVNRDAEYVFTGKTADENSLVCLTADAPRNAVKREDGWRGFYIEGVLDFSLIGILSEITGVLADNKIGVFAVSTYNTDYIFVKSGNFQKALTALAGAGFDIAEN